MIHALTDARFDDLTDLVGIPLAVLALLMVLGLDVRRESGLPARRWHLAATIVVGLAALAVIVLRFARLAT